ncbi:hypothetical protein F4779DRAFT_471243 [Xylariaceae sp. FL0662B]|nr:hypothetical protein F4779DRAFT_471243 [Xylariaceae sp. FL0662B]
MAMTETSPLPTANILGLTTMPDRQDRQERTGRRRPFATWVKKLANFKNGSSSAEGGRHSHFKRDVALKGSKKRATKTNNNPYPQSGRIGIIPHFHHSDPSLSTAQTGVTSDPSLAHRSASIHTSADEDSPRIAGATSMAYTISTDQEANHSIHAPSHMASSVTGTSRTANGGLDSRKGGDSTFSSPAPSVRSLTTTLTTIQSMGPNGAMNAQAHANANAGHSSHHNNTQTIQFSQPFPTTPASAIPPHLAPLSGPGHPATYQTATANNLLTDNASILTLASSSQRRRRRSMDTDASVRALAPSSLWGGSRESLPLSVLSANVDGTRDIPPTPGLHQSTSRIAGGAAERTSIYSATGIGPATERNSLYAPGSKQQGGVNVGGDGASVRSGLLGHGRADSINGSIAGVGVNSPPLVSPRELSERGAVAEEKDENAPAKNANAE